MPPDPEIDFYAIALDGDGAPCCVCGYNAQHLPQRPGDEVAAVPCGHTVTDVTCALAFVASEQWRLL